MAVILPASTRKLASSCWLGRSGPDDQQVRLVGVAHVPDVARDHPEARLGAQEPAADLAQAAQRPRVAADVDAHLGLLVHERDRAFAIAAIQQLEEQSPSCRLHPWRECSRRGEAPTGRGSSARAGAIRSAGSGWTQRAPIGRLEAAPGATAAASTAAAEAAAAERAAATAAAAAAPARGTGRSNRGRP